jgi:DNA replication and repair protein RecF
VLVESIATLGFRNLDPATLKLEPGLTLLWGANGAGKTNLLEALCFALAGRSPRTRSDRDLIAFGAPLARAEAVIADGVERRSFLAAAGRTEGRRHLVDGSPATPASTTVRPPLSVFLPDRLALVKGAPATRRSHLDRFCAALWPARAEARRRYARALAQRNALLGRVRAGQADRASLDAWDHELAIAGVELIACRAEAAQRLAPAFEASAAELGIGGEAKLAYRPRTEATEAAALVAGLAERREADISRGYTGWGPHLDEVSLSVGGRALRRFGSQGQQRIALLALLFAEREALLADGRPAPLMLLDDVTSELDGERRELLCHRLAGAGQTLVTATEPAQLPRDARRTEIAVREGRAIVALADAA